MLKARLEYEQTIDGTFRGALEADKDPGLAAALRRAGLDLSRLAPAYRAEDFYRWMQLAARHRWPDLDEAEGCRRIGRLCVERGLPSTALGRALLQFIKVLGPRFAMLRLGTAFRSGNNYIKAYVTELGPTTLDVELGPLVGPPTYFQGILEAGPARLGAKNVQVRELRRAGENITWRVEWSE